MKRAFAAIGVGFSLSIAVRELKEAAQAAAEDQKSMNLLALAMENTGKATKDTVAQAESAIRKMQIQAGVADDELRPAYQKLFIATKDVTQSNRLLQIALDASAATGKGLDVVSQAMAKSLAGSDTALVKLIPSLKGAKDPIAELERAFAGAASEAANTDPYQRMQIIFGEMQEQIGMALMPVLSDLSTWLATPEGEEKLGQLVELIKDVVGNFADMAKWILDNKDWLVPMVVAIGAVTSAWKIATTAVEAYKAATLIAGLIGVGGTVLGAGAVGAGVGGFQTEQNKSTEREAWSGLINKNIKKTPAVVQNITIKGSQSAQQIAYTLTKQLKSTGSSTVIRGGR